MLRQIATSHAGAEASLGVVWLIGLPGRRPGKTRSSARRRGFMRCNSTSAGSDSGTRCTLSAFMRDAGMIHVQVASSTSLQAGFQRLAGTGGGEDQAFQRAGADVRLLAQAAA